MQPHDAQLERPSLQQLAERIQHRIDILKRAVIEGQIDRRRLPREPPEDGSGASGGFRT
jgi:hypothetical protein